VRFEADVALAGGLGRPVVGHEVEVLDFSEPLKVLLELLSVHVLQREVPDEELAVLRSRPSVRTP